MVSRRSAAISRADGSSLTRGTLAEAAGDVVLRALLARVREDLRGLVHLDQAPRLADAVEIEEPGAVAHPRRLLHVVGDDHDRVLILELAYQVLDCQRGDRVERRAGLVHEEHLGFDGDRPGDAEPLLLTTGQAGPGLVQPSVDLLPEAGPPQRALDGVV